MFLFSVCDVENCNRCSGNPKLCDKCDTDFYKFYSVRTEEDHCLAYCPNGFRAKRAENGGFICEPGNSKIVLSTPSHSQLDYKIEGSYFRKSFVLGCMAFRVYM